MLLGYFLLLTSIHRFTIYNTIYKMQHYFKIFPSYLYYVNKILILLLLFIIIIIDIK